MWKSVQVICMIHVLKLLCSAPTVENEQGGGGAILKECRHLLKFNKLIAFCYHNYMKKSAK